MDHFSRSWRIARSLQPSPPTAYSTLQGLAISAPGTCKPPGRCHLHVTPMPRPSRRITATITWPGGGTNAGIITEDASDVFHVSGHTHVCTSAGSDRRSPSRSRTRMERVYQTGAFNQTNIGFERCRHGWRDRCSLINPWGMASSTTSPIWVSDQGSGLSTLYNPNGSPGQPSRSPSRSLPPAARPARPGRSSTRIRRRPISLSPRPARHGPINLHVRHAGWNDRRLEPRVDRRSGLRRDRGNPTGAV